MKLSRARDLRRLVQRTAVAIGLAGSLAGCGGFGQMFGAAPPPPCPQVSVLKDAAVVTRFRDGGGKDLVDILHEGEITGFTESCEYDVDDDSGIGTVQTEISVQFTVTRGAADRGREAALSYFIALTDPDREILAKRQFNTVVAFPGNLSQVTVTDEPVGMAIPISPQRNADFYEIFVGFQLTPEEMTYNRQQEAGR